MQRVPMTPRGKRLLEERLHNLKAVERPQNIEDIETARAHGDLSENAEYKFAKDRQGEIDMQIRFCETHLALAEVIDPTTLSADRVVFGATVALADLDTEEEFTYQIVGEDEADIERNLLSVTSPLAQGLIGKEESDVATIRTPKGIRKMEIISIQMVEGPPPIKPK
jgi:transcription elongation factor GreA